MDSRSDRPVITFLPGPSERRRAAEWVNARIGRPYRDGATGPDAYSCWPLVREGLRDLANIGLPEAPIGELVNTLARRTIRRDWRPSQTLQHLSICMMGRSQTPHHVGLGLLLDGGVVLHAIEGAGVIVSSPIQLRSMGFQKLRFAVYSPDSDLPAAVAA